MNKEKCEIKKNSLTYFGYVLRTDRLSPDPEKVKAVTELQAPTNAPELLRVIGMTNYIGMFVPMTNLLKSDRAWTLEPSLQEAFVKVKQMISGSTVLAFYDPKKLTVVCAADVSS